MVTWIIGLSGAGKSTLANRIFSLVKEKQSNIVLIDGDVIREVFGNDLGHSLHDRRLNADRICRLCKHLDDSGIHVVCAILSIFEDTRKWNRQNIENYYEIFIDCSIDDLIERDPKGLYGKYRKGEIENIVGMDIEFSKPENSDLIIKNHQTREDLLNNANAVVKQIIANNK